MLPIGETENPRQRFIKFYCPRCQDVYFPASKAMENVDGAFFGTSFPHMFMMSFPEMRPKKTSPFVASIFGFKIHESSKNHPIKIAYNTVTQKCEPVPRPIPTFSEDETKLKQKLASRGPFINPSVNPSSSPSQPSKTQLYTASFNTYLNTQ